MDNSSEEMRRWFKASLSSNGMIHDDIQLFSSSRIFGLLYILLGFLAIILNLLIICSLLRRQSHLSHAYYILIFNFSIIDSLKGISSILYATKLLKDKMGEWGVTVDQYSGLALRFANIVTILNLMMITFNEYMYISYPLRYETLVTRNLVVSIIASSWIVSAAAVIGNSFVGTTGQSLVVDTECLDEGGDISSCVRREESSALSHYVFHMAIVIFCLFCLALTVYTYFCLMRIISKLISSDIRIKAEVESLQGSRKRGSRQGNALGRRKYAVVIGSVIMVYSVYLLTYAIVQVLQMVHVSQNNAGSSSLLPILKYVSYTFISLHSLLQPLCYFRVKEFRCIMKRSLCGRVDRRQRSSTQ